MLCHGADRFFLVVTLDDRLVDWFSSQVLAFLTTLNQQLELVGLVKALHFTWRIILIIPEPCFVAICVEDQRTLLEFGFEAVSVQLCLLTTDARILPGTFCFDHPKR